MRLQPLAEHQDSVSVVSYMCPTCTNSAAELLYCCSVALIAELSTDIMSDSNDLGSTAGRAGAGSNPSAQTARSSDNAWLAAEESELMRPQVPQQQVAGNGTCAKLYEACTCSTQ